MTNPINVQRGAVKGNKRTKLTGTPMDSGGVKQVRFKDGTDTLVQSGYTNEVAKGKGGANLAGSRAFNRKQQGSFKGGK